jgi:hypothetical protein
MFLYKKREVSFMISSSNMTNPISAIRPNFGILTLKHNASDIASMRGSVSSYSHDTVERGKFEGNIGQELSARELAKQFG